MKFDDIIRDEKLQFDIKREAAKISSLSSSKIDKYEYLTDEEILPSNRIQIIKQAKFRYFPLGKDLEKQAEKQANILKSLNHSNKTDKLKQTESIFSKILLTDLIIHRVKK